MGYTIHISFSLQIRQSTESIKFSLNIPENHLKSENGESITNEELPVTQRNREKMKQPNEIDNTVR